MSRLIIPEDAPQLGSKISTVDGPAGGRVVEYTGTRLNFAEVARSGGYVGDAASPVDGNQLRRVHVYLLEKIDHPVTGKFWVYLYSHTEV